MLDAKFIDSDGRRLFVLRRHGGDSPRKRVLVVPPLFEELNRCRRMLALCGRVLVAAGYDVVLPDLSGTGDSAGGYGDASWQAWAADLANVDAWAAANPPQAPAAVLCVRAGTLLLPRLLASRGPGVVVAWQPVLDGGLYLQQFLRLRAMASKFAGGSETVKDLLAVLERGEAVEVAGYEVSSALGAALSEARVPADALPAGTSFAALECRSGGGDAASAPVRRLCDALAARGEAASATVLDAEQFWATQEIAAPAVVADATVRALEARGGGT